MILWKVGDRVTLHGDAARELCQQKMRGYWRHGIVTEVEGVREDGELMFRIRGVHYPAKRLACGQVAR